MHVFFIENNKLIKNAQLANLTETEIIKFPTLKSISTLISKQQKYLEWRWFWFFRNKKGDWRNLIETKERELNTTEFFKER